MILEFEPQPPDSAQVAWEWHVWDHTVQNYDESLVNYGEPSRPVATEAMSNPVTDVQKFGQSIWYDNIRRSLITSV